MHTTDKLWYEYQAANGLFKEYEARALIYILNFEHMYLRNWTEGSNAIHQWYTGKL